MFLHTKLENKKEPIRVAFIGCGKFVSMFLAQYNHLDKIEIDSIVDINIDQAKKLTYSIKKIFNDHHYPILIDEEGGRVSRLRKFIDNAIYVYSRNKKS